MTIPDSLPLEFKYDAKTQTLEVLFGDGSIILYHGIDSRLAFLSPLNERRNYDFFRFLSSNQVKQEVLRERTVNLPEPGPNPLKHQQNGEPVWLGRWGYIELGS